MKKIEKFIKVKEATIQFIKNYMIDEMKINEPLNRDSLCEIVDICNAYDEEFVKKELNPNYVINNEQKCFEAGNLVSDITGIWSKNDVDIEDLNKRLGLA